MAQCKNKFSRAALARAGGPILFGFGLFVSLSAHSHHPHASAGTRCTLLRWCRGCLGAVLMAVATSALRKGARPLHDRCTMPLTAKAERRKRRKASEVAAASVEPTVATEAPEPPAESHNEPEMEHITSISQALAWWLAKRSPRCHVCVRTSRVAELYSEAGQRLVVKNERNTLLHTHNIQQQHVHVRLAQIDTRTLETLLPTIYTSQTQETAPTYHLSSPRQLQAHTTVPLETLKCSPSSDCRPPSGTLGTARACVPSRMRQTGGYASSPPAHVQPRQSRAEGPDLLPWTATRRSAARRCPW